VVVGFGCLHNLKNKRNCVFGQVTFKLDMSKAYDRVNWNYLKGFDALFGFPPFLHYKGNELCGIGDVTLIAMKSGDQANPDDKKVTYFRFFSFFLFIVRIKIEG